jgi:tetratricopeptide (TPR) repeat protein
MKQTKTRLYFAATLAVGLLLYAGTMPYPMVFDDEIYLIRNPIFKEPEHFLSIFTDFAKVARMASQQGLDGDISTNFLMRPLTYLSFHINHRLGGLDPRGYRMVNITIHLLNAALVGRLVQMLLERMRESLRIDARGIGTISGLSGLVFLVHPLQLESVVYVIQRATSLCTLFYLLGVVCHFRANQRGGRLWRAASVLAGLAAMLCKESGATLPVVALLLDWWACGARTFAGLKAAAWRARFLCVLLPLVPLLLTLVSSAQTGEVAGKSLLTIAHGGNDASHALHYALTQPWVWWRYLALFLWPFPQNADPEIPMVLAATDPRFWAAAAGLCLLFCLPAALHRLPAQRMLSDILAVGLAWFALTIAPDSTLVPLPDAMAEHRTYLPSVGLCMASGFVLWRASERWTLGWMGSALCLPLLFSAAYKRREAWASVEAFWSDVCSKSPGKPRPWINLGAAHYDAGRLREAEEAFLRSIQAAPTVPAIANLAAVYLAMNNPSKAHETAKSGLPLRPSGYDASLLGQLAYASVRLRLWEDAVWAHSELLKLQPSSLPFRMHLAGCYLQMGNASSAVDVLRAGLTAHPGSSELRRMLAEAERIAGGSFKLRLGN